MHRTLMRSWLTLTVILSSVACVQRTPITVIVTAIVTATPMDTLQATDTPQPTTTPLPLGELDIASLLVRDGDLPAGYSGGQIRDEAPSMFGECPAPVLAAYRQVAKNEETVGGVTVLLYESTQDITDAYTLIADGMTSDVALEGLTENVYETSDIGDEALVSAMSLTALGKTHENLDLLFSRCQAVVHVRLSGTLNEDAIIAYGKRLDSRLQPVVCQE